MSAASAEVRVTSRTGGQKGRKLARFGLIPAGPLRELAELYGRGAEKYSDDNWRKGYDWSLSFDAMMRHAWAFWDGEDIDEETGAKHIICAVWHGITLAAFMVLHPGFDNRPSRRNAGEGEARCLP
ncbi:dATP/dGTP diphosphohydrolase domain-containing protein [Nocardia sp. NPDC004722]